MYNLRSYNMMADLFLEVGFNISSIHKNLQTNYIYIYCRLFLQITRFIVYKDEICT